MTSVVTAGFRGLLGQLPDSVRQQAARAYALWRADPHHPSLQFKRVGQRLRIYSANVGLSYQLLGLCEEVKSENERCPLSRCRLEGKEPTPTQGNLF